jgi:GNAT superfamily N-acetyltransferase
MCSSPLRATTTAADSKRDARAAQKWDSKGELMSDSGDCLIREAEPGLDDDAVAALMAEYLTWAIDRLATEYGVDEPPTTPALVRDGLASFRSPAGRLLLAECDGGPVGVGAIRTLRPGVAEVKRMYVAPGWRDQHVGSAILDRLLDQSREMGATTVLLDTCRFMTDAQRLYRSRGFVERSPYEGTEIPPRLQHLWIFFERTSALA